MKPVSKSHITAAIAGLIGLASLVLPAAAETIYLDEFNDQQNINSGGTYTQTLAGSVPTVRSGTLGGSASATWTSNAESGGWGQRDYGDNNVATPTSSNYLAFTPQAGYIYRLEADITVNANLSDEWFAIGFTATPGNWGPITGAYNLADYDSGTQQGIVRFNATNLNQTRHVTYTLDTTAPGWTNTQGIAYVGWFTGWAGNFNLNSANQVSIDNFKLTSGVANPTVTYNGNGSDGGTVPTDGSSPYTYNATVTTLGAGTMTRSGFTFTGWNTAALGNGTHYNPGDTFTIQNNTTLYAKWIPAGSYTVTYSGNGNTGGSAPVDASNPYSGGSTVTVLGNTGSLSRTSFTFSGWNTTAIGSGTNYNPADTFTINANTTLYARWTPGPDYVWNDAAVTGLWNTADANWSGATWSNSATNNAFFTTVGGSVSLDPGIVAGAVNVGNSGINFPSLSLIDGDLTAASLTVQGFNSNGSNYGSNPTLSVNSAVTVSGDAAIGRSNLAITGGTFTANRIISAPASADWARLVVSGGTVTATNGVDGSVYTGATFAIDLNGGELLAPSIRVADRESAGFAWLTFNGGTLKAIGADNADFITTYGGGQTTFVEAGGAIIDTNGRNIGLTVNMVRSGSSTGGLTKEGTGTLTLGGAVYNYRGNTLINDGALNVSSGSAMEFFPTTSGSNNSVSAGASTATLSFLGQVYLDLSAADPSGTWNLFNVASFTTAPVLTPNLVNSTLGAFTETSLGSGVWELPVTGAKWVFTKADGNLTYVVTATPYETWGLTYGLGAGTEAGDLDNDGVTNFQEFAFGLIPNDGSSVNPITSQLNKSDGKFTYKRLAASGLSYTVWTSPDLVTWNPDATAGQVATPDGNNESVQVTLTGPLPADKLFVRVKAE